MTHDPLCPQYDGEDVLPGDRCDQRDWDCRCDLIQQVRRDEGRKANHLRLRIERLVEKADRWRDEAAHKQAAVREAHERACDECLNAIEHVMDEYVGNEYKQGQLALGTAAELIRVYVKGAGRP